MIELTEKTPEPVVQRPVNHFDAAFEVGLTQYLNMIEKEILEKALIMHSNNKTEIAQRLKINRTCLLYRIRALGLTRFIHESNKPKTAPYLFSAEFEAVNEQPSNPLHTHNQPGQSKTKKKPIRRKV